MALQARRIGETLAQYNRRVGKKPPTTVRRPTTTKQKPVTTTAKKPPTQKVRAKVDPDRRRPIVKRPTKRLPKGKPIASIDYFDKDGKRVIVRQDDPPTRRTPRPKRPTVDPRKKIRRPKPKDMVSPGFDPKTQNPDGSPKGQRRRRPPRTPTPKLPDRRKLPPRIPRTPSRPPKNLQALIEELKRRQKDKPKRPRLPTPKPAPKGMEVVPEGYKTVSFKDAGFKPPPKGSATTSALVRFYNPKTKEVVIVPSGGYTPAKGFIRSGSLGGPLDRRPRLPVTKGPDAPTIRPPRPPANNVEKFLAGRKPNELNRQDKIRFTKELYKFNKERRQRNVDQARQQIIERFRNDPARLQSEIARLDRNVRMGDAVEKFKAGMVGVDALKKLGIPARSIDQLMFDRKMFLTPESPAKLDTILKRRLFQANRNYRDQYKRMIRQGASRGDILRMQRQFREYMRSMRQNFARQKAELEQKNILRNTRGSENVGLPRSPRAFASIFGPR